MGERCKLPQQVRAEPCRQTIFSAFWAENASGGSNFKGPFATNMVVFSLFTSNITWGNSLLRIFNNKLKFRPHSLGLLSLPYFIHTHLASRPGVKLGGRIPLDLRSGTSCLRATTSNDRSCTSQLRSGTFFCWYPPLCTVYI